MNPVTVQRFVLRVNSRRQNALRLSGWYNMKQALHYELSELSFLLVLLFPSVCWTCTTRLLLWAAPPAFQPWTPATSHQSLHSSRTTGPIITPPTTCQVKTLDHNLGYPPLIQHMKWLHTFILLFFISDHHFLFFTFEMLWFYLGIFTFLNLKVPPR